MALAILDGTQTATTLSTILSSGQHITAHTVVSLGTQAKTDILSAVSSGIAISGTVTVGVLPDLTTSTDFVQAGVGIAGGINNYGSIPVYIVSNFPLPEGTNRIGVVTIGAGTVTIGAGTAQIGSVTASISGTVTANITTASLFNALENYALNFNDSLPVAIKDVPNGIALPTDLVDSGSNSRFVNGALPISGTVTVGNTVTIAGTVTANPTGTQTIAGSVTLGAGTSQIGSVTASLQASSITGGLKSLTYQDIASVAYLNTAIGSLPALVAGTAQIGSVTASISGTVPVSISSVTIGNSVTIASLPAISGTVTANLSISATAISSGSFTSLASATLVPGNTARKMATVFNQGAGQLFVNAGATATTLGGGFMVALNSGDYFECDYTTTTLSAIFATAGTASWMSH